MYGANHAWSIFMFNEKYFECLILSVFQGNVVEHKFTFAVNNK